MTVSGKLAAGALAVIFTGSLLAGFIAPHSYDEQFRDAAGSLPSRQFPLGTDDLGRDRLSRLLYGSRVSLVMAPCAAVVSTLLAGLIGGIAGMLGGRWERAFMTGTDLFLSLPWLFLLIAVRALLPLNTAPSVSVAITFLLLGSLGWAPAARVVRAAAHDLRRAQFTLQARIAGISETRLFWRHLLPNLRPVLTAQFLISIPVFIIAEANLGLLGLGVSEPLPSLGAMLRDLENLSAVLQSPLRNPGLFAPLILLMLVVTCFQLLLRKEQPIR
jgi:ABC-type dipeptide/oligopeptide/nickel transport system permease subunit